MSALRGTKKHHVIIIQNSLRQYRKKFFVILRENLHRYNMDFTLIYGIPDGSSAPYKDLVELPWGKQVRNRYFNIMGSSLCWQPCFSHLRGANLVIIEQASKYLLNYVLFMQQVLGIRKIAFWGHGRNFSPEISVIGERIKYWMSRRVHWWFAYNELSASVVRSLDYPRERITNVQNAIDTKELFEAQSGISSSALQNTKIEYGISGANIGVFVGAMYENKRMEFLVDACTIIREQVPDFQLLAMGAGPKQKVVEEASLKFPWIKYLGPQFGDKKVGLMMMAKVLLMPGTVGLVIIDSFVFGAPLVTTGVSHHSPEISYLVNNENGVIVGQWDQPRVYAEAVSKILLNEDYRLKLVKGCCESAKKYTVEEMASRFTDGICQAMRCI